MARWLAEIFSRVIDIIWGAVSSFLVDDPKLTHPQVRETLQARGNIETLHARDAAAEMHRNEQEHGGRIEAEKSAQQESDLRLAHTLGTPHMAEANLHEPVRKNRCGRHF
jgi:hypothetical protein